MLRSIGVGNIYVDSAWLFGCLVNSTGERTTWTYDAASRETQKQLANGTQANTTYNTADWITVVENVKSAGAILSKMTYTYDPVGNRTKLEVNSGVIGTLVTWTYDKTNQLTREQLS